MLLIVNDKLVKLDQSLHSANSQLQELKKLCKKYEERQYTLDSIKNDDESALFYKGFQNYEALKNFYWYIEPKLEKSMKGMQP